METQFIPVPELIHYPSRTGGEGHNVKFATSKRAGIAGPAGTLYATCDCIGGRNFRACWAVKNASKLFRAVVIAR